MTGDRWPSRREWTWKTQESLELSNLVRKAGIVVGEPSFKITVTSTALGMYLRGESEDGRCVRSCFCENEEEYNFEYDRTLAWIKAIQLGTDGEVEGCT